MLRYLYAKVLQEIIGERIRYKLIPDLHEITWLSNLLKETTISFTDMFETLIQQALNWEGGVVFIPLAFGLVVGLGYVIISAARHKKGT